MKNQFVCNLKYNKGGIIVKALTTTLVCGWGSKLLTGGASGKN